MPLWSNQDWRARIGSCWCALGRTFNTRFTRCRGKSQRYLSTHQAATMVIMMILFIAANMGLYVTRERHKNLICVLFGETITELHLFRFGLLLTLFVPVLKFVVQMVCGQLPRKLKISLKQFFIDLNDSLWFIGSAIRTLIFGPVLFVVNFTTGNICNVLGKLSNHLTKLIGDRLSNGILTRSLVVVIIVTIQLLVSVVIARAIIYLLLLISGDIERNGGPGHIDYSVTKELLVELETTAVQASLLLRCGDVESNPGPLTREGGVNQDVERNTDKVVKSGQITDSDRMFKDLALVTHDKFMEIGLELGLEYQTLCNELEVMKKGSDKAMKMLQLWKQSNIGDNFTYSELATALEKHGHKQAAHKFCYTESKPQQCDETHRPPTVYNGNNPSLSAAPIQSLPSNWTMCPEQNLDEGFDSVPDPKRCKLDPSEPPLGQVPLTTHDLQHIDRWRRMLVDCYLAQEHSTDVWPPLKIVKFIKLALVKEDEQAYHLGLQTVQKNIDAVYGQKSNASYETIFRNINSGSLVLFEGRPGSGKTTLMVRASCDWGKANIFKSKVVIFVRLRHLNKSRDVYLHDLLHVACPAFTPDDVQGLSSYIEGRLGEDVVFLLDGFDEYAPGASDENYISKLILKLMYTRSIIILSSRPAATQRFRQNAILWIEVVGFMKEQVLQYINCYFERNKEKSSSLIQHLEEHENLMNLCYLPLHCAMLVFLYKVDATLPETETEFYRDFTLSLLIRGIRKHTKMPPNIESFDSLSNSEQRVFHKVCKLAFKATLDSQQVFKERELKDIKFGFNNSSEDSLGLVVIDRYFAKSGTDESYTFLHLTLQEYLAAVFVSRLSESQQIDALATHFCKQHLFMTTCFLFGIMDYSKEVTKKLFKQMLDATKDALLHHIQCAYESQSVSACTDVVNFHEKSLSFESINNSSIIYIYITYVLKSGKYDAIELSFSHCSFDISDAVSLLQGVGKRQLSLTIEQSKAPQSMLNALSRVTVSGLVELVVTGASAMGRNNLKHSTNLQKLTLWRIDISNFELEKALKHWPNLVKLDLRYCHIGASTAVVLGESLQHTSKLQTLRLNGIDISNGLVEGFKHLPNLVELALYDFKIDASTTVVLVESLQQHTSKLQTLKLSGIDISNGLVEGFKHLPNLVELAIGGCKIDASTAVVLGESLQHTSKLQTLTLSVNPIGDDGLHALSLPIKNYCKELKKLRIWETQLTDRSITCLTEWIEVLNNLEKLDLARNHFSEEGVKQIEEAASERNTREGVAKLKLDIGYQQP